MATPESTAVFAAAVSAFTREFDSEMHKIADFVNQTELACMKALDALRLFSIAFFPAVIRAAQLGPPCAAFVFSPSFARSGAGVLPSTVCAQQGAVCQGPFFSVFLFFGYFSVHLVVIVRDLGCSCFRVTK